MNRMALDLIQTVRANGGQMRVDAGYLVIAPDYAALPIVDQLRQHKTEIIRLLEARKADSSPIPSHDPAAWRDSFAQWLGSACAEHTRAFGGVSTLHIAYCEWETLHYGVGCTRETFERLLQERGFLVGEVAGTVLVSGLAFRDDVDACL